MDVLSSQASSVACEHLFSQAKLVAVDHRARLGADRFEEIQVLRPMMCGGLVDLLGMNTSEIEHIASDEWMDTLVEETQSAEQWAALTDEEYFISD
jgi:hypothetical protein